MPGHVTSRSGWEGGGNSSPTRSSEFNVFFDVFSVVQGGRRYTDPSRVLSEVSDYGVASFKVETDFAATRPYRGDLRIMHRVNSARFVRAHVYISTERRVPKQVRRR